MIALMILGGLALYIAIAVVVTRAVVRAAPTKKGKWIFGTIGALVFLLIPTWDAIIGRNYFAYLCDTQGGNKIFRTVEVGEEYFLKAGEINFGTAGRVPAKGGEPDIQKLLRRYKSSNESSTVSKLFRIEKSVNTVTDPATEQVLGTRTSFFYFGGWLINSMGLHVTGDHCPLDDGWNFYSNIFRRAQNGKFL